MNSGLAELAEQNSKEWEDQFKILKESFHKELYRSIRVGKDKDWTDIFIEEIHADLLNILRHEPFSLSKVNTLKLINNHITALVEAVFIISSRNAVREFIEIFEKLKEEDDSKISVETKHFIEVVTRKARKKADQEYASKRQYLPNRKYTPEMFEFFQVEWDKLHNQQQAYDEVANKFGLDPDKADAFIRQFRSNRPNRK